MCSEVSVTIASGLSGVVNAYKVGNMIIIAGYVGTISSNYNSTICSIPYVSKSRCSGSFNPQINGAASAFSGYLQCEQGSSDIILNYNGTQASIRFVIPVFI